MTAERNLLKARLRGDYAFFLEYRTRWADNDMYGHLNNSIYNFLIDSVVNAWLAEKGKHEPLSSHQRGLVVHSEVDYFRSMSYPDVAELGLSIISAGRTSIQYEIGVFVRGESEVRAVGKLIHVFVDTETGKPSKGGFSIPLREALDISTGKKKLSKL